MGVISRRVLPTCGSCFFSTCPGLRTRSRKPLKRYKKLLADVFPKTQDGPPNERAAAKLAEYAARNPERLPKVAQRLEERMLAELRASRHLAASRAAVLAFSKLLAACQQHMSVLAPNVLTAVRALLDHRSPEARTLGCHLCTTLIYAQIDPTYVHSLEAIVPLLVGIARESGDQGNRRAARAAGLQALAAMIWLMHRFPHASPTFNEVAVAVLDSYAVVPHTSEGPRAQLTHSEALDGAPSENHGRALRISKSLSALSHRLQHRQVAGSTANGVEGLQEQMEQLREAVEKSLSGGKKIDLPKDLPPHVNEDDLKLPEMWAAISVLALAILASDDISSTRRVVDPLLLYFDNGSRWDGQPGGFALNILMDLQLVMDAKGTSHLLRSVLVRHLEAPRIAASASARAAVAHTISQTARHSRTGGAKLETPTMVALLRQLSRSLEVSTRATGQGQPPPPEEVELQAALCECMAQIARLMSDSGALLEVVTVVLELLPGVPLQSQATMDALLALTSIAVDHFHQMPAGHQALSETLLIQLLQAMSHSDAGTRTSAHKLLAALVSAAAAGSRKVSKKEKQNRLSNERSEQELLATPLRGDQALLLLSSLWLQAGRSDNPPPGYVGIANTFHLVVAYSGAKNGDHDLRLKALQLALSLRTRALDPSDSLAPSRKLSLFTLATATLAAAGRTFAIPELTGVATRALHGTHLVDPYLLLDDNGQLHVSDTAASALPEGASTSAASAVLPPYGTPECDMLAKAALQKSSVVESSKSLPLVDLVANWSKKFEMDVSSVRQQLMETFKAEDSFALRPSLFQERPLPDSAELAGYQPEEQEVFATDEAVGPATDGASPAGSAIARSPSSATQELSSNSPQHGATSKNRPLAPSVGELLSSVGDASRVGGYQFSPMASPGGILAAYGNGSAGKGSAWEEKVRKFTEESAVKNVSTQPVEVEDQEVRVVDRQVPEKEARPVANEEGAEKEAAKRASLLLTRGRPQPWEAFQLPATSPYDNFLKAAGS